MRHSIPLDVWRNRLRFVYPDLNTADIEELVASEAEERDAWLLDRVDLTKQEVLAGYKVVNPLEKALKALGEDKVWEEYMAFDVQLLLGCDLINFLQGWTDSQGARLEAAIAKRKGIGTLFFTGMRYE